MVIRIEFRTLIQTVLATKNGAWDDYRRAAQILTL